MKTQRASIADIVLGFLFVLSAALQYNDPDPAQWVGVYLLAAAACFAPRHAGWRRPLALAVAVVTLIWAGTYLSSVLPVFRFDDLFRTMKAENPAIEESRELLGLLIIAGWMVGICVRGRRRSAKG